MRGWSPGERAMAILAGGGYAEEVVVPAVCAMRAPAALSWEEAAALPEVFLTVFLNVFELGALPAQGTALVHGGGSGIGTAAIQLVRAAGGCIVVTAGSDEKCERCLALGAVRYLRKPIEGDVLVGSIEEAVRGKRKGSARSKGEIADRP